MFDLKTAINEGGRDVTGDTVQKIIKAWNAGRPFVKSGDRAQDLNKATVSTSTGLVAYNLESPSQNLYPVLTPLRNRVNRTTNDGIAGTGPNWREISAITGGGLASMPWVAEGQRAARMSVTETDRSATYVTIGEEADVTFEAQAAARGFEDENAMSSLRLLQSCMIKEEYGILGGNRSVLLGTPTAPTVVCTTGGAIADGTYDVRVVALTYEGYRLATVSATGCYQASTITGMDGQTYVLNGGSSQKSNATSTGAISTGNVNKITAMTPVVTGAVAYAWYVGPNGGNVVLQAITTINSVSLTSLSTTTQNCTGITADCSRNSTYAFNGLLYAAWNSANRYFGSQATGTYGTGTGLTSNGKGGVTEIDTAMAYAWDNYRIAYEEIYVSSQELQNMSTKALSVSGGANLMQFIQPGAAGSEGVPVMIANSTVGYYFNPYSMDGGNIIPVKLHPYMPAGTIMLWCRNLPAQYQNVNVPLTAMMDCRRDYYQIDWPLVTRAQARGVYAEEVMKVYAPFAIGIINNIGNA